MKKRILLLTYLCVITLQLTAQYIASNPIVLSSQSNKVIDGKSFTTGTNGISISLTNCSNIRITNCQFILNSGIIAIQLKNCSNIEIDGNYFEKFRSGVYAISCTGGIDIHCNVFKDIAGIKPRGQMVQFNSCNGTGNRVNYNTLDHTFGSGNPEDLINMYASSGVSSDPIQIIGNHLRGGGPSTSGGGIMVGDNGGHDLLVQDNIIVDPGQYGIGVPAGYNIKVKNNKVYGKQQSFTNVGIYVGLSGEIAAGFPCQGNTIFVEGNQVNWTNKNGVSNGFYNCSCCPANSTGNNFKASINGSILPIKINLNAVQCGTIPINKIPTIMLTSPLNNATYSASASVTISANAADEDGTISKVEFYNGTTLLNTDATSPYSYTWSNVPKGSYSIFAKAYDNNGAMANSLSSAITVNSVVTPVNQLPVVSFVTPASNTTFTAPADLYVKVDAADLDGTISNVLLFVNNQLVRQENIAPYEWGAVGQNDPIIKGLSSGSYVLKAVATDNNGGVTTKQISITVTNGVVLNSLPIINISSPVSGTSFNAPASVTILANASDADGIISKVEFYNGSTLLSSDNTSPYSYTMLNLTTGNYTIIAKAIDNKGGTASSSISFTIKSVVLPTSTSGISGSSCVTAGSTVSYFITPENTSFSSANYWSNSGAVVTKDVSDAKKFTVNFPSYMNGTTITLFAGVNYSVSPWYKEYTKTIKIGGCSAKVSAVLSPQPTENVSILSLEDNQSIYSIIIFNSIGDLVYQAENVNSASIELGSELAAGMYVVQVISASGVTSTRMIKK